MQFLHCVVTRCEKDMDVPISDVLDSGSISKSPSPHVSMLTGPELVAKVKELGDVSKSELVRSCGYVSVNKDGTERLNFTAFYEALLEAKGVEIGGPKGRKTPGRKLSYRTRVQFNGNLLIGSAYTSQLDLRPGDEFEIKLGRRTITLIPMGAKGVSGDEVEPDLAAEAANPADAIPSEEAAACVFGDADVAIPDASELTPSRELAAVA